MDVIESRVDTSSDEYKKNYSAMETLVCELREELRIAREDRSEKALKRHEESGKMPAGKKLELLLDRNTPFLELAPLAARGMYDGKVHGAGILAGIGRVEGKEVLININDATIKGGSVYPMGVKKALRLQQIAMENRLPGIGLVDSAGAYLPMQSEIFPDIDDGGRVFYNQAMMSKMGIAQITAVMGLCTAGGAYGVAMSDEIVHVKGHGAIFLGGPPLVKAATGEEVSAEDLGGAFVHTSESGVSDYMAENDADAIRIIRNIVKNLPPTSRHPLPMQPPEPPLDRKSVV